MTMPVIEIQDQHTHKSTISWYCRTFLYSPNELLDKAGEMEKGTGDGKRIPEEIQMHGNQKVRYNGNAEVLVANNR